MQQRWWAGALMAILTVGVTGCGDDDGRVRIDEGDAGSTIEITLTDVVELTLEGNASTGYEWQIESLGPVELVGEAIEPLGDLEGSPERHIFTFRTTVSSSGTLRLVYLQPWIDPPDPAEIYEVTVIVSG